MVARGGCTRPERLKGCTVHGRTAVMPFKVAVVRMEHRQWLEGRCKDYRRQVVVLVLDPTGST